MNRRDAVVALFAVVVSGATGCRAPARTDGTEAASAPAVVTATSASLPSAAPTPQAPPPTAPAEAALLAAPATSTPAKVGSESPAVARRTYVVAAIGDSLTDYRSHGGGYLRFLEQHCPHSRFDNFGKGGDMVNQMRKRLEKDVFEAKPAAYTHLIVFGGVNDLYSDLTAGRTVPKIEKDLSAMYAGAHQRGMKVVALTVSPWGGFSRYFTEARGKTTLELNGFIAGQAGSGADYVVDTYSMLACGEKLCDPYFEPHRDGLHFGPEAHRKVGEALLAAVFSDCR